MDRSSIGRFLARHGRLAIIVASSTVAVAALATPTTGAGASAAHRTQTSTVSASAVPAKSAPLSAWKAWAASQRATTQSTNWVKQFSNSQCKVTHVGIRAVTSNGLYGVPKGIVTDEVAIAGSCANSSPTIKGIVDSTNCPVQTDGNAAWASGGVVCVGTATVAGVANYMAASYTRTAGGSSFGHAELGVDYNGCGPGDLVANGKPEVAVTTGSFSAVLWGPRIGTNRFSATWWQDNLGGDYAYFGSACGVY